VTVTTVPVAGAYRHCQHVTSARARNFSYGIRLLPAPRRRALSAVYAFARRIDDIGDGRDPVEVKLAKLAQARDQIREPARYPADPVLVALADAARRLPIPLAVFSELIDGCEMDVRGRSYATAEDLVRYCRCVAGSIGRLSLGTFSTSDRVAAVPLADALGIALQLTNILRDLREDRLAGRVYLPAEDLERFGCSLELDPAGTFRDPPDRLVELVRFEAGRGETWYAAGLSLLPLLDRRSAACCAAMAGIYHRLLARVAEDPARVLSGRVSLPGPQKAAVAARALIRGRP
jgi:15-cis-phytoene synthase